MRRVDEFSLTANGFKCLFNDCPESDLFHDSAQAVIDRINGVAYGLMQMMASLHPQPEQHQQSEPPPSDGNADGPVNNNNNSSEAEKQTKNGQGGSLPYLIVAAGSGTSCILVRPTETCPLIVV